MLPGGTISSETSLESKLEHALLTLSKIKTSLFLHTCLTVRFMAYLRATEKVNGNQKFPKVPFATTSKTPCLARYERARLH